MSEHHHVDFFELPVTDIAAAKAFYAAAFGWSYVDYGPDYADIRGAGLSGGLRKDADGADPRRRDGHHLLRQPRRQRARRRRGRRRR